MHACTVFHPHLLLVSEILPARRATIVVRTFSLPALSEQPHELQESDETNDANELESDRAAGPFAKNELVPEGDGGQQVWNEPGA